ncbi:MAG: hypothetical protein MJE68_11095, partial [Proteobacteria bacterium]|nr:hypothetical protein [Pseudomonadota bacterium]
MVRGGEGCIGFQTTIVVLGGERYKSKLRSGDVRVNLAGNLPYIEKSHISNVFITTVISEYSVN